MKLKKSIAGSIDSNDVLVEIKPLATGSGLIIELESPVAKQFGKHMKSIAQTIVSSFNEKDILLKITDNGALDWTLKARIETAIRRSQGEIE